MTLTDALLCGSAILAVTVLSLWMYLCQWRTNQSLLAELRESNRKVLLLSTSPQAQQSAALTAPQASARSDHRAEKRVPMRMSS